MIPLELYDRQIVPKVVCHEDQSTKQKRHIWINLLLPLPLVPYQEIKLSRILYAS